MHGEKNIKINYYVFRIILWTGYFWVSDGRHMTIVLSEMRRL